MVGGNPKSEDPTPSSLPQDVESKETKPESNEETSKPTSSGIVPKGLFSNWRNRISVSSPPSSSNPNDPSMSSIQAVEPTPPPPPPSVTTTKPNPPSTKEAELSSSTAGAGVGGIIGGLFKRREAPEITSAVSDDEEDESSLAPMKSVNAGSSQKQVSDPFDIASPELEKANGNEQPANAVGRLFGRWGKRPVTEKKEGQDWKDDDFDWLNNVSGPSGNSSNENGAQRSSSLDVKNEQDWFAAFEGEASTEKSRKKNYPSTFSSNHASRSTSPPNKFLVSSTTRGSISKARPKIQGLDSVSKEMGKAAKFSNEPDWDAFESIGESSNQIHPYPVITSASNKFNSTSTNFAIPPPPSSNINSLNRSQSLNTNSTSTTSSRQKSQAPSNLGFGFISKQTNQQNSNASGTTRLFSDESNLSTNSRVASGGSSANSRDGLGSFGDWSPNLNQPSATSQSNQDTQKRSPMMGRFSPEKKAAPTRTSSTLDDDEPIVPSVPLSSRRYGNPAMGLKFNHQSSPSISGKSSSFRDNSAGGNFEGGYSDSVDSNQNDFLEDRFGYYDGDDLGEPHPHASVYDDYDEEENHGNDLPSRGVGKYSDRQQSQPQRVVPPPLPHKTSDIPPISSSTLNSARSSSPLPPLPKPPSNTSRPTSAGSSTSNHLIGSSTDASSSKLTPFLPPPPAPARKAVQSNSNSSTPPLLAPPPSSAAPRSSSPSLNPVMKSTVSPPPPPPSSLNAPGLKHLNQTSNGGNRNSLSADELSFFDGL